MRGPELSDGVFGVVTQVTARFSVYQIEITDNDNTSNTLTQKSLPYRVKI